LPSARSYNAGLHGSAELDSADISSAAIALLPPHALRTEEKAREGGFKKAIARIGETLAAAGASLDDVLDS